MKTSQSSQIYLKKQFLTQYKKLQKPQQCPPATHPPKPKPWPETETINEQEAKWHVLRLDGCLVSLLVMGTRTFASEAHERLMKPVAFYLPWGKGRSCVVLLSSSLFFYFFLWEYVPLLKYKSAEEWIFFSLSVMLWNL